MNPTSSTIRPASLTSLRFFAIIMVVLHHLGALISWQPMNGLGSIGVTFFFILSGFVITLNYGRIATQKGSLYFLWNRLVRLYPLHLVTFVVCLSILFVHNNPLFDTTLSTAVINILLLQSYFSPPAIHFSFNSVSWALSTLFSFYLIFAFVILKPLRNFFLVFLGSLASLGISLNYIQTHECSQGYIFWLLERFPPNRASVFLSSMVLAFLFMRFYDQLKKRANCMVLTVLECISLLLIFERIFFKSVTLFVARSLIRIAPSFHQSAFAFTDLYLSNVVILLFTIGVFALEGGLISKLLTRRFFVFLGEISFAVYMCHQIFFRLLRPWRQSLIAACGEPVFAITACLMVIPLSYALYACIEVPVRNRFKKVW